jgi:hypothetical protein
MFRALMFLMSRSPHSDVQLPAQDFERPGHARLSAEEVEDLIAKRRKNLLAVFAQRKDQMGEPL